MIKFIKKNCIFLLLCIPILIIFFFTLKLSVNAETIKHYLENAFSSGYRIRDGEVNQHSGDSISYVYVSSGITYYCDSNFSAYYNGGTSNLSHLPVVEITFPFTPSSDGRILINSSIDGVPDDLKIYWIEEIQSEPVITSIFATKTTTSYECDSDVVLTDISAVAHWDNGTTTNLSYSDLTISYDSVNHIVTVTYGAFTDTINITITGVLEPIIVSITCSKERTSYASFEDIDYSDITCIGTYDNGNTVTISHSQLGIVYDDIRSVITISYGSLYYEIPIEITGEMSCDFSELIQSLDKLDKDINDNLYEVRLLLGFVVALLIMSIALRRFKNDC